MDKLDGLVGWVGPHRLAAAERARRLVRPRLGGGSVPGGTRAVVALAVACGCFALMGCEAEAPGYPEAGEVLFGRALDSVVLELRDPVAVVAVGDDVAYLAELTEGAGEVVSVSARLDETIIIEAAEASPLEGSRRIGGTISGERLSRPGTLTLTVSADEDVLAEGSIEVQEASTPRPD